MTERWAIGQVLATVVKVVQSAIFQSAIFKAFSRTCAWALENSRLCKLYEENLLIQWSFSWWLYHGEGGSASLFLRSVLRRWLALGGAAGSSRAAGCQQSDPWGHISLLKTSFERAGMFVHIHMILYVVYVSVYMTYYMTHTHTNIDFRATICSNVLFSGGFLLTFYHTWRLAGQHIIIWKQRIWTVGTSYQNVIHLQVVQFQVLRKENKFVQDCNGLSHCGSTVWRDASYLNCYS